MTSNENHASLQSIRNMIRAIPGADISGYALRSAPERFARASSGRSDTIEEGSIFRFRSGGAICWTIAATDGRRFHDQNRGWGIECELRQVATSDEVRLVASAMLAQAIDESGHIAHLAADDCRDDGERAAQRVERRASIEAVKAAIEAI